MKKSRIKNAIMGAVCFCLVALSVMAILGFLLKYQSNTKRMEWNDGWSVSVNGGELQSGKELPDYKFANLCKGDTVELVNVVPEDIPRGQTVSFLIHLSTVEAFVDDELVYSYGLEYAKKDQLVGSGYHYISIPEDAGGKEIVIRIGICEDNAFTNVLSPYMDDIQGQFENMAKFNMLGIGVGSFLAILGIVLMLISGVAICYNSDFTRLIYIGAFSFLMGLWTLCSLKVLQIFNINMATNTVTEYLTLYFAPVAFCLLIADVRKDGTPWRRQMVLGVALLLFLFAVVTTVLQITNLAHYPEFLGYFHVFGAISLLVVIISSVEKKRKVDRSAMAMYVGICFLILTVLWELLRFNIQKYILQENEWLNVSILPVGTMIFIICVLVGYIFHLYAFMVDSAEREWLTERAYKDELCGLANRTKCNEVFDELNVQDKDYAFINIDLNGLKSVNDSQGHLAGDRLLKEYAQILQDVFHGIGQVFRISGDEFLVIILEEQFPYIDQCLNRMVKLEKRRSADLPFVIDSSYGVAKHSECMEGMTERVYTLADQRMYEMKTKKKINRRLRK